MRITCGGAGRTGRQIRLPVSPVIAQTFEAAEALTYGPPKSMGVLDGLRRFLRRGNWARRGLEQRRGS